MTRKIVQMMPGSHEGWAVLYDDGTMYVVKSDYPSKSSQWKRVHTPDTDNVPESREETPAEPDPRT